MRRSIRNLLVVLVSNSVLALTSGPTQPEYMGFTPSTLDGMVDLFTGDFTYSIPLLEVPGPSLSYPLTLGYRAGIELEQEATWVGLGWTLTPGSINHAVNRYPDDYLRGQSAATMSSDDKVHGWDAGLSVTVGGGGLAANFGDRSDQGYHFGLDLVGAGFATNLVSWNERDGYGTKDYQVSTFGMVMGMVEQVGSMAASTGSQKAMDAIGIQLPGAIGLLKGGASLSINGIGSIGFSSTTTQIGAFHAQNSGISIGFNVAGYVNIGLSYRQYAYWISKTDIDKLYGYFYLGEFPDEDEGDAYRTEHYKMEYNFAPQMTPRDLTGYNDVINAFTALKGFPVSTYDGYSVRAEGLATSFRPYRQDIGTYFGMDRHEASVAEWITWIESKWWSGLFKGALEDAKKEDLNKLNELCARGASPFLSNSHPDLSDNGKYPVTAFREAGSPGGTFIGEYYRPDIAVIHEDDQQGSLSWWRRGAQVMVPRWDPAGDTLKPASAADINFVEDRVSTGMGIFPIFQDDWNAAEGHIPHKALRGFTVVRQDGMVYEYHKPVFTFFNKVIARSRQHPELHHDRQYDELDLGDNSSSSSMERAYAYSWLLTAVKGPDYVDMNGNGISDDDIGGWVRFNYDESKHIKSYHYRTPFDGIAPSGVATDHANVHGTFYDSYGDASWGAKEIYYLTDMYTPTHHAKFSLSDRDDGKEAEIVATAVTMGNESGGTWIQTADFVATVGDRVEIEYSYGITDPNCESEPCCNPYQVLNQKVEFQIIRCEQDPAIGMGQYRQDNGATLRQKLYLSPTSAGNCFEVKQARLLRVSPVLQRVDRIDLYCRGLDGVDESDPIKTIRFGYETAIEKQLCRGIPNSADPSQRYGKLTLRTVEIGTGGSYLPPYSFDYYMEGDAASYDQHHWDRWGFYKHDGGFVPIALKNTNIADWDALLDTLNAALNSTHLAHQILSASLQTFAKPSVITRLTSRPSAATLSDVEKTTIVEALNRIVKNEEFYKQYKSQLDPLAKQSGTDIPIYTKSNAWHKYMYSSSAEQPAILLADGTPRSSPSLQDWEHNAIHGFNLALLSEMLLLKGTDQQTPIKDSHRIIMKFLDVNRFDHNPVASDAVAWSLRAIKMPSGATLNVDLEADDYSFVGRSRAAEPVAKEDVAGSAAEIANGGFFRKIGLEKDLITSNSMLKIRGWGDDDDVDVITQDGNRALGDVKIRVTSLFRLYRNVGTETNPHWQMNEDFRKLEEKDGDERFKLNLIAMFDPMIFNTLMGNPDCNECGRQVGTTLDGSKTGKYFGPIPIRVDTITEPFTFLTISEDKRHLYLKGTTTDATEHACQRRYVEFTLGDLRKWENWEYKRVYQGDPNGPYDHQCKIRYFGGIMVVRECDDPAATDILVPGPNKNAHFMYNLAWARRIDFNDQADCIKNVPRTLQGISSYMADDKYHLDMIEMEKAANKYVRDAAEDGDLDICYRNANNMHEGLLSWKYLNEFSDRQSYDEPIPPSLAEQHWDESYPHKEEYWDYYSANAAIRMEEPDLAAHVAGIIGGGVRVKRLTFNSGWPQRSGAHPLSRTTEYLYVCQDADGRPGNFSSGATASIPPPFNNKGDDRPQQTPQTSLLTGSQRVTYGTVHEIRPGRGKIIYNFLTSADIADYWADDSSNYYYLDKVQGVYRKVNGPYNADPTVSYSLFNPNHRWRLNRCSHFQGLMYSQKKYTEAGEVVSDQQIRYQTSMTVNDLCNVDLLAKINDYDSRADFVLIPTEKVNTLAGSKGHKYGYHPLSDNMGKTVERYRMRWLYDQPEHWEDDVPKQNFTAANEVEVIEHSIRQYSVQSMTQGVGTKTVNAYFDFVTGQPLMAYTTEADPEPASGCVSCGEGLPENPPPATPSIPAKVLVTVPAYWVDDFNNVSRDGIAMGPAMWDTDNKSLQLGLLSPTRTNLQYANMLYQPYSVSVYSDLPLPPCTSPACVPDGNLGGQTRYDYTVAKMAQWATRLRDERPEIADKNALYKRDVTIWRPFVLDGTRKVFRKSREVVLRAPMTADRRIDQTKVVPTVIDYPWAEPGEFVGPFYVTSMENTQYDQWGHVLESKDANGSYATFFYSTGDKGLFQTAQVLNSRRTDCAVLTCDEHPNQLSSPWTTTGTISTTHARSGTRSLMLGSAQTVTMTASGVSDKKRYLYSFWVRSPATGSVTCNSSSQGISASGKGPRWRLVKDSVTLNGTTSLSLQITSTSGAMHIDDIRVTPEDAHASAMTYDINGWITSYAGPDDVINYYDYDAFGRLAEVRDHEGVVVSTQAQLEAK